jgi:hypothetical protein
MRESALYKPMLAWLKLRGVFAWRNNTGAFKGEHNGKTRFIRFGFSGISDILGILPGGRALAIEVKMPGNPPTGPQIAFLDAVKAQGGVAFIATGIDDIERELEGLI